jgi:hypothetical protein
MRAAGLNSHPSLAGVKTRNDVRTYICNCYMISKAYLKTRKCLFGVNWGHGYCYVQTSQYRSTSQFNLSCLHAFLKFSNDCLLKKKNQQKNNQTKKKQNKQTNKNKTNKNKTNKHRDYMYISIERLFLNDWYCNELRIFEIEFARTQIAF